MSGPGKSENNPKSKQTIISKPSAKPAATSPARSSSPSKVSGSTSTSQCATAPSPNPPQGVSRSGELGTATPRTVRAGLASSISIGTLVGSSLPGPVHFPLASRCPVPSALTRHASHDPTKRFPIPACKGRKQSHPAGSTDKSRRRKGCGKGAGRHTDAGSRHHKSEGFSEVTKGAPLKASCGSDKKCDKRLSDPELQLHHDVVCAALKDLHSRFDKNPKPDLNQWFATHAESLFPHLDKKAYAVPDFFIGCSQIKPDAPEGTSLPSSDRCQFRRSSVQDSTVRGDRAQCRVGCVFRLYSMLLERLEKPEKKPMFVISQLHFDNLLAWLRRPPSYIKCQKKKFFDNPKFSGLEKLDRRGEMDLMALHPDKGVLFVQIKATGAVDLTHRDATAKDLEEVIQKAKNQLDKDADIFRMMMQQVGGQRRGLPPIVKVVALPYLTQKDIAEEMKRNKDVVFLCKDDLPEVLGEVSLPDSEMTLDNFKKFKAWLEKIPNKPLKLDIMKEIIGKYVGLLSTVVDFKDGNKRDRFRLYRECVHETGRLARRLILSNKQVAVSKELRDPKKNHRAYISGPPGSGKTLLLMLEARTFLSACGKRHVIVLNMYRGSKGRAIGRYIFHKIRDSFEERVHHLPLDVTELKLHRESFVETVENLTKENGNFCLEDLMFIVDEIYTENFWKVILDSFAKEFRKCRVLCAGLFSATPAGFYECNLDVVHRCPPAVQKLLHHVDWDERRKGQYAGIPKDPSVATNGPTPLSVRHRLHKPQVSVTECRHCAKDVVRLLREENLVQLPTGDAGGASGEATGACGGWAESPSSSAQDDRVVILVNIPRRMYQKHGKYIETTRGSYQAYMRYIAQCPFIQTLKEEGLLVDVKGELACMDLVEDDEQQQQQQQQHLVTWIYNFQGLETNIVIFLPGDTPWCPAQEKETQQQQDRRDKDDTRTSCQGACAQADVAEDREIPAPGLRTDDDSSSLPITSQKDLPGDSPCATAAASPRSGKKDVGHWSTTPLRWTLEDIGRFTPWDKTNILVAGSRCLSLLILLVP